MITREQMIERLRSFDPRLDVAAQSLDPAETFNPAFYRSKRKETAFFEIVSDWSLDQLNNGNAEIQRELFGCFEDWLVEGDLYVQGAAQNRMLTPLVDAAHEMRLSPLQFYPMMGSNTLDLWNELVTKNHANDAHLILKLRL